MIDRLTLADDIKADLLADAVVEYDLRRGHPTKCFLCRGGFIYRGPGGDDSGRFCGQKCRDSYDAGLRYQPASIRYPMRATRRGFLVKCGGCEQEFDSAGLAFCSLGCERVYRDRQDTLAIAAQIGHEVRPHRICEGCGGRIPRYTATGRVTRASVRFCGTCKRRNGPRRVGQPAARFGSDHGLGNPHETGVPPEAENNPVSAVSTGG